MMQRFRKELKFIMTEDKLSEIESRLRGAMRIDDNQHGDYYVIRSIYFDSPTDVCVRENLAGIGDVRREKYRIRAYGRLDESSQKIVMSDNKISAEIKIRYRDTISKQSEDISREQFNSIILNGDYRYLCKSDKNNLVYDKYIIKLAGERYTPKTIVEYKRCAYTYRPSNVRITFDRDITASNAFEDFFESKLYGIPVMEKGMHVLEVKYDEFLPDEIRMLFEDIEISRTSCSKYCLCREALSLMQLRYI